MKRKARERLIAAALTALLLLLLVVLAGNYRTRRAQPAHVALAFAHGYSAPPAPLTSPAPVTVGGPRRVTIDAGRIPTVRSSKPTLEWPGTAPLRTSTPLALQRGVESTRSRRVPSGRQLLVPRTRPQAQGGLALTQKAADAPHVKPRTVLPLPQLKERTTTKTEPASMPELKAEAEELNTVAITQWMRLQPAELPPGIRRHIEHTDGSLTSVATLDHDGATYELYLMARLALRELHVVLVAGETSYYLIDRSFQREGRSFRTGTVRRSDGVITGIVSEERAAASAEARHFYRVFLSWWDAERLKLQ